MSDIKSMDEIKDVWSRLTSISSAAGTSEQLQTALTFDDILLVPQHSTVVPGQVDVEHAAHETHPAERAARERRHGHGHRVAARDRDGAAGRPRRHSQEHVDRGAGVGGRSREALRERDDRRSDHAFTDPPHLRSARSDEEVPHLRRADHRRRQQGRAPRRHPDQSRSAVRDERQPADLRRHDARAAVHGSRRHDARRRARDPARAQGRETPRGRSRATG